MNQTQRSFLIEELKKRTKEKIKELRESLPDAPNLANFAFAAILKGELKLRSQEEIMEYLKNKALKAKEGTNWMSDDRMGYNKERSIRMPTLALIESPSGFKEAQEEYAKKHKIVQDQIAELEATLKGLTLRIQLATPSVLANLIKEVDDMGQLSLVDNKLKLLM